MKRKSKKMSDQVKEKLKKPVEKEGYDGNDKIMISTGCTILDLALTGTRVYGGGLPVGIAVEVFGGKSAGKTVLLCEIAGAIQRAGGDVKFNDSEARLDKEFAKIFDMEIKKGTIETPDTVAEIFKCYEEERSDINKPYGIIADSVAAASTEDEMKETKGYDGAKRANDFSTGFRKYARKLATENYLMVFSNQLRANMNAGTFGKKTKSTGGFAPAYYTSLRLDIKMVEKLYDEKKIYGKMQRVYYGIKSEIFIEKSSVDKSSFRTAPIYIDWDHGIDDIKGNLVYIKQNSKHKTYSIDGEFKLGSSINQAIEYIEDNDLEGELKEAVIKLWNKIQRKFKRNRKKKVR